MKRAAEGHQKSEIQPYLTRVPVEVDSRQERDERLRIFMKESNFTILLDTEIVMVQNKGE